MAEGLKQFQNDTQRDPNAPEKHFVTKGEHRFDRMTYAGLGYVANVALSLGAVYWAERMPSGQKFMTGLVNKFGEWFPKIPKKWSGWAAARSFYLTGGFAVLVPMKLLEDRKVDLIKKWDKEIYGPAVDDPQIEQSHRELEQAPKQSWSSMMGSRMLSLAPFYATTLLVWSHNSPLAKITNSNYRKLDSAAKKGIDALESSKETFSEYSQHMKQGFFFDRPIAAVSRWIGKATARMGGNVAAAERIAEMESKYPAMLKEGEVGTLDRDPNHSALPYYFISEAITSAIVARAIYLLTRVLGPVIGRDAEKPAEQPKAPLRSQPYVHADVEEVSKVKDIPAPHIAASSVEHHATAVQPELQAAR